MYIGCSSFSQTIAENIKLKVESVVATCNQRLYLLAQLKKQGLGISALDSVFKAIVLNKILNALPVYFGYLTEDQRHMLQRVLLYPILL